MLRQLTELVDAYSRRIYPAVLDQHDATSISSPLGIWLLLAACATAAVGSDLVALESVLGCSATEASEQLAGFLASPPPALATAVAVWMNTADQTQKLLDWRDGLPPQIEAGSLPSQAEADAWANRHTLGLIEHFPVQITDLTRLVLSSALATKVSWKRPFDTVPANECLGEESPWSNLIQHLLIDRHPHKYSMLVRTQAAGIVAAHFAVAAEELAVVSVSADPALPRHDVLHAAHEVAALYRTDRVTAAQCSLFDLPLGEGHTWVIAEREVPTDVSGARIERISGATLPAWRAEGDVDLKGSELFGTVPALAAMLGLIGPHPAGDKTEARQSAVASYTRHGFEAAAVTAFAVLPTAPPPPLKAIGVERTAELLFDHPYAAIALAFSDDDPHKPEEFLAVFGAWVATPQEPEEGRRSRRRGQW